MKRLYLMIPSPTGWWAPDDLWIFTGPSARRWCSRALGRGTRSDDVLSYLGLEATEKAVLFSVVTPACKDTLVKELVSTMHLSAPGSGIAVCLPLSSIGGKTAMNYLTSGDPTKVPEIDVEEDETMKDAAYQLIVAIANQGYTDKVMEAARSARSPWRHHCPYPQHRSRGRREVFRHVHCRGAGDDLYRGPHRREKRHYAGHHGPGGSQHQGPGNYPEPGTGGRGGPVHHQPGPIKHPRDGQRAPAFPQGRQGLFFANSGRNQANRYPYLSRMVTMSVSRSAGSPLSLLRS